MLSEYTKRLTQQDHTLKDLNLTYLKLEDSTFSEIIDCLLEYPNCIENVYLGSNQLTDESGVKLARYVASSSTIINLILVCNQFGETTYLQLAKALCFNSSLRFFAINDNKQVADRQRIETAFIDARRLNPTHSNRARWLLYTTSDDFDRLKYDAELYNPPAMLEFLLYVHLTA